jgi:hypothetical protein
VRKIKPRIKTGLYRSAWESDYALRLDGLRQSGVILAWQYEAVRLKLAPNTTYTPDFMVITPGEIQFIEIKGQRRAAGMAKFKVAADLYPWFRFVMVERKNGNWSKIAEI